MPTMIITNAGEQAFAAATNVRAINLAEVRLGSGHNATPKTATALTAPLAGLVYPITPVTDTIERYAVVERLDANAISLQCVDRSDDAIAPTEIGLFTTGGALIAYYSVGSGNIFNKAASSRWQFAVRLAFSNLDTATIAFTQNAILPATEARAGIAQIATQAEARAGVDDTKFVTPSKMLDTIGQQSFQIHDLTAATPIPGDSIAFGDASETGEPNRKATISDLFARAIGGLGSRFRFLAAGNRIAVTNNDGTSLGSITLAQLAALFRVGGANAGTPTLTDEVALMDASANADSATGFKPNLRATLTAIRDLLVEPWAQAGTTTPVPAGRLQAYQQIYNTAGTYTWTKPSGFNFFRIQMWGGGGQGLWTPTHGGALGGGGAYIELVLPQRYLSATEQVIVGETPAPVRQNQIRLGQRGGATQFKGLTAQAGYGSDNRGSGAGVLRYGGGGEVGANVPPNTYQEAGRGGDTARGVVGTRPYFAGSPFNQDAGESVFGYEYGVGSGSLAGAYAPNNGSDGAVIITAF